EGIPRPVAGWEEWSKTATPIFQGFRSDKGEEMILDRNAFVERVLPGSVLRKLSEAEMTEYRKPYLAREDRWPTLTWPRQIPIAGEPVDVVQIAADYSKWMAENDIPKLFVNAEPGAIPSCLFDLCRCFWWPGNDYDYLTPGSGSHSRSFPMPSDITPSPIILTGDRTTGPLHLGHYVGSLRNRVELQTTHEQYVLLA